MRITRLSSTFLVLAIVLVCHYQFVSAAEKDVNGKNSGKKPENGTKPGEKPDNGTKPGEKPGNGTKPDNRNGKDGKPDKGKSGNGTKTDNGKGNGGKPDNKGKSEAQKKREMKLKERDDKLKKAMRGNKKASEVDKDVKGSIMRVDKKGSKVKVARKGELLEVGIEEIVERMENETQVKKYKLKDIDFKIVKNENASSTYNVSSSLIELQGNLPNNAIITFQFYMFSESGNITGEDGNIYEVLEGGTKANYKIEWSQDAEMIDMVIFVKCGLDGKGGRKAKKATNGIGKKGKGKGADRRNPDTFSVCPNAMVTFSPSYLMQNSSATSNKDVDMPSEYPMIKPGGGSDGNKMVLRFTKSKSVFYDPLLAAGDDIGDPVEFESSSSVAVKAHHTLFAVMCAVAFTAVKFLMI